MINRQLALEKISEKVKNDIFSFIVVESFISALPFDDKDLDKRLYKGLRKYSETALESLGKYNLLETAISNPKITHSRKIFLNRISDICEEAAIKISKRRISSVKLDGSIPFTELIEETIATEAEKTEIVDKIDELDMKKISEIIKNKTLTVIKREKDEYEKDGDMEKGIMDLIGEKTTSKDTDDDNKIEDEIEEENDIEDATEEMDEEIEENKDEKKKEDEDNSKDNAEDDDDKKAVESYFNMVLDRQMPRTHISFFSKLQAICTESVIFTNENYKNIPFKTLSDITFNKTFKIFKPEKLSLSKALESITNYVSEPSSENIDCKITDGTVCAIIICTFLETLKTLNLYSPSVNEVQDFVENKSNLSADAQGSIDKFNIYMLKQIELMKSNMAKCNDSISLFDMKDTIEDASDGIEQYASEPIKQALNEFKIMIDQKIEAMNTDEERTLTSFDKRDLGENIVQFDKLSRTIARDPDVNEIKIIVDDDNEKSGTINVDGIGRDGRVIKQSFAKINYKPAYGSYAQVIKEAFESSKLFNTDKRVIIYNSKTSRKIDLRD